MGLRSKFMTEDFSHIPVPDWFNEKYSADYYIGKSGFKYVLNISSKHERPNHFDILDDIASVLKSRSLNPGGGIIIQDDFRVFVVDLLTGEMKLIYTDPSQ